MKTIYRWTAQRSGAAMTITGFDKDGAEAKITGVISIVEGPLGIRATGAVGDTYELDATKMSSAPADADDMAFLGGADAQEEEARVEAFLAEVRAELLRARDKFPGDRIMTLALAEEFGELVKAVLDEPPENVRKEAVQVAVMAARVALDGDSSVGLWRAEAGLAPMVAEA